MTPDVVTAPPFWTWQTYAVVAVSTIAWSFRLYQAVQRARRRRDKIGALQAYVEMFASSIRMLVAAGATTSILTISAYAVVTDQLTVEDITDAIRELLPDEEEDQIDPPITLNARLKDVARRVGQTEERLGRVEEQAETLLVGMNDLEKGQSDIRDIAEGLRPPPGHNVLSREITEAIAHSPRENGQLALELQRIMWAHFGELLPWNDGRRLYVLVRDSPYDALDPENTVCIPLEAAYRQLPPAWLAPLDP